MMGTIFALLLAILPACQAEDSTNCAWNARTMGNGMGVSFVAIGNITISEGEW